MGDGNFRPRLRFLRFCRPQPRSSSHPISWVNNAPRAPPIPAANRMSDASSSLFTEETPYRLSSTSSSSNSSAVQQDEEEQSDIDIKSTCNEQVDGICVICLDTLSKGASIIIVPGCGHSMWHANCLRKWFRISLRCPLCAATISTTTNTNDNDNDTDNRSGNQLPWTLSERRVNDSNNGPVFDRLIRRRTSASSQDIAWVLFDRRISLASRPSRRRRNLLLSQTLSTVWR